MIPKEQIERAKRADLPMVLKSMGIELVPNSRGYHLKEHDSLKLFQQDGIWLYKWWSRNGEVGDGIQYLQRHCGTSFPEAVAILSGTRTFQNTKSRHVNRQNLHCLDPIKKPEEWRTQKWQSNSEELIRVGQSYLLRPNGKERISYLVHDEAFTLTLSGNVVWDGCPQKTICLRNSLFPVMIVRAISSESDFVLIPLILDRNGTKSLREATLTHLIP
jgi:hypothetical protein